MKRKRISLLLFIAANLIFLAVPVVTYYMLTGMINNGEVIDIKKAISLQTKIFNFDEIEEVEIHGYGLEQSDAMNRNLYFINVDNQNQNHIEIDTFLVKYTDFKVENKKLLIHFSKPLENENQYVQSIDEKFYIQLKTIPKKITSYDCSGGFYFHKEEAVDANVTLQNSKFKFNYHLRDFEGKKNFKENNFNKLSIQASNSIISFSNSVNIQDFKVWLQNESTMSVTNITYNNLDLNISSESSFYDNFQHLKKSNVKFID